MKSGVEHAELLRTSLEGTPPEGDQAYYVCQICGHVSTGFVPDNCPVCHAVPGRFKKVD